MRSYYYDDLLPYALKCGMTTEEFWNGEPRVLCSYIRKHELELDEINRQAWLFGLYTYKAVSVVIGNFASSFSKNGSSIAQTYFEKPIEQFQSNYKEEKIVKETESNDRHRQSVNYWAHLKERE